MTNSIPDRHEKLPGKRDHIQIRGIYGGIPTEWFQKGQTLEEYGVNAIWIGAGSLSTDGISLLKAQGAKVFAEFNTLHDASYLKDFPDAAPIGTDGRVSPPPDGWQGICPTHPQYRQARMDAFRSTLHDYDIDGIWLDYHHSHASWEQAIPNMPDTCFCERCLSLFSHQTGIELSGAPVSEKVRHLWTSHQREWIAWRCNLFTDWVREFRGILNEERPRALLGSFHCPWNESEYEGALREKLAIDLKAQSEYLDVFSIMPYHARFGHADDIPWISQQVTWLGRHLGIQGIPGERHQIWPIVQLSDWGESVQPEQVGAILEQGSRLPVTGLMVFAWGSLRQQPEKVEAMGRFYRNIAP